MELIFSEILSLPFILPDCWTWTACTAADAPRGITTEPPIITGSSTIALNVCPACETSTSIACVSRTFSAVPAGTVTGFGAAGSAPGSRCRRRCWCGGFRAENSTATVSSIRISDTLPLSRSTRTVLLSPPMNMPSTTLPDRSRTRSAESDAPAAITTSPSRSIVGCRIHHIVACRFAHWRWEAKPKSAGRSPAAAGARPGGSAAPFAATVRP